MSRSHLLAAFLAAIALLVFWPLGRAGFVSFDDPGYVSGHRHLRAGLTWEGVRWATTAFYQSNWHPLTLVSHMLDNELFGSDPRGPHLVNVALHTLNSLLIFRVLQSLTGAMVPALLVAAFFAFHPLHVESVAWVSERKDVLSAFFWLLGLSAYVRRVRRPSAPKYALVALCFAAGLAAKPMLVTFPLTLLILDYWPLGRFRHPAPSSAPGFGSARRAWSLVREKIPLFALAAISAVFTIQAQFAGRGIKQGESFSLAIRLANAVTAPVFYLRKLLAPVGLSVFYPHPLHVEVVKAGAAALMLLVITTVVARQACRRPWLVTGWLWYLATLVPVLGLIQVGLQAAADRYTYVPLLGIFVAAVWTCVNLVQGDRRRTLLAGAFAVLALGACVSLTRAQLAVWRDTSSLFGHALRISPDNWLAHNSYGADLMSSGRGQEAIAHYREAIRLNPGYALPHNNLAVVLAQRGELAEAIAHYREAIRLDPGYADAWYNLGNAFSRIGEPGQAAEAFRAALEQDPEHIQARNNLARILIVGERLDEALAHLRAAEEVDPGYLYTLFNIGLVLQRQGHSAAAEAYFRQVLSRDRGFPGARQALVSLLESAGRSAEAREFLGQPQP